MEPTCSDDSRRGDLELVVVAASHALRVFRLDGAAAGCVPPLAAAATTSKTATTKKAASPKKVRVSKKTSPANKTAAAKESKTGKAPKKNAPRRGIRLKTPDNLTDDGLA